MSDDTLPTHYDAKRRRFHTSVWLSPVSSTLATNPCPSIADFNVPSSIHAFNVTLYRVTLLSFYQIDDSETLTRFLRALQRQVWRCSKGSNNSTDRLQFPTLWSRTFSRTLQFNHLAEIQITPGNEIFQITGLQDSSFLIFLISNHKRSRCRNRRRSSWSPTTLITNNDGDGDGGGGFDDGTKNLLRIGHSVTTLRRTVYGGNWCCRSRVANPDNEDYNCYHPKQCLWPR